VYPDNLIRSLSEPISGPSFPHAVMSYTLCASEHDLAAAVAVLSQSQYLVLDCEGRELGMQGGALSLLQIGTARAQAVFLVDALSVPRDAPAMRALAALLGRADLPKLVWDGRMDAISLRQTYGIVLRGVLDLQLAEILSRTGARGELDSERLRRLGSTVGQWSIAADSYKEMHTLAGLDTCLRLFGVGLQYTKTRKSARLRCSTWLMTACHFPEAMKAMHQNSGSALWMARPLSAQMLTYAGNDVRAITTLYEHFSASGWLRPTVTANLPACSARYLSIHDARGPVDPADVYRKGPFLPLDVLTEPTGDARQCSGCLRALSLRHFEVPPGSGRSRPLQIYCRACAAMKLKLRLEAEKARAQAFIGESGRYADGHRLSDACVQIWTRPPTTTSMATIWTTASTTTLRIHTTTSMIDLPPMTSIRSIATDGTRSRSSRK
jgi:exonuclease 3'-5' domain-containing protein 1